MYARLRKREEELIGYSFKHIVTFEIDQKDLTELPEHCELTITQYSPDRNIDQNAKYWSVVGEIAKLTGTSKTVVHNQLLYDYGEIEMRDGEPIEIVMPEKYDYLSDRDLHLAPTGELKVIDGNIYARFYKLVDSKHLTKKQFSRLIDGAIDEYESLKLC